MEVPVRRLVFSVSGPVHKELTNYFSKLNMTSNTTEKPQLRRVLPTLSLFPRLTARLFFRSLKIDDPPQQGTGKLPDIGDLYDNSNFQAEADKLFILSKPNVMHTADHKIPAQEPSSSKGVRLPPLENFSNWESATSNGSYAYGFPKISNSNRRVSSVYDKKLPPLILPIRTIEPIEDRLPFSNGLMAVANKETNEDGTGKVNSAQRIGRKPDSQPTEEHLHIREEKDGHSSNITGLVAAPPVNLADSLDNEDSAKTQSQMGDPSLNESCVLQERGRTESISKTSHRVMSSACLNRDAIYYSLPTRPQTSGPLFHFAENLLYEECPDAVTDTCLDTFDKLPMLNGTEFDELDGPADEVNEEGTAYRDTNPVKQSRDLPRSASSCFIEENREFRKDTVPKYFLQEQLVKESEFLLNRNGKDYFSYLEDDLEHLETGVQYLKIQANDFNHPNALAVSDEDQNEDAMESNKQRSFSPSSSKTNSSEKAKPPSYKRPKLKRPEPSRTLQPQNFARVADPQALLQNVTKNLASADWEKKMQGIREVTLLAKHHQNILLPELHNVNLALLNEVRNLRSQVSRAAIQAIGVLFESCGKIMEPDLDKIGNVLLHKCGDMNRFIREDAHTSLVAMTDAVAPPRAIACVVNEGLSHKNAVVRTETARLLAHIVKNLGGAKSLNGAKDVTEKLLPAAAQLLQEGSQEARTNAKKIFAELVHEPLFEKALLKHVQPSVLRSIRRTVDSLKNNAAHRTVPSMRNTITMS